MMKTLKRTHRNNIRKALEEPNICTLTGVTDPRVQRIDLALVVMHMESARD
jgi:hypothetical protein